MPALLLPMPFLTALDNEGMPIANAKLYLYETGGTTNAVAYTNWQLSTPHEQPIVADAAGRFPAVYLQDTNAPYRAVLKDAAGNTLADIDRINGGPGTIEAADLADGAVTGAKMAAGAAAANLGYTPLNKAGDTATDLDLIHTTPSPASAGYLGAPVKQPEDAYTVLATDMGKLIRHDSPEAHTYSIAADLFGDGGYIGFRNVGAGLLTISPSGGAAIKALGSGTPGAWLVAQHGEVWLRQDSATVYYISGIGYS